eukprot:14357083-Alexandrium_andersonii.AAC.1
MADSRRTFVALSVPLAPPLGLCPLVDALCARAGQWQRRFRHEAVRPLAPRCLEATGSCRNG